MKLSSTKSSRQKNKQAEASGRSINNRNGWFVE